MADNHSEEMPLRLNPSPRTPTSPLQLSGSLSGDTIQVQGDAHNVQFSFQFSLLGSNHGYSENQFQSPAPTNLNNPEDHMFQCPNSPASYVTPITTHEQQNESEQIPRTPTMEEDECLGGTIKEGTIMTRLRSGALLPVTYYPAHGRISYSERKQTPIIKRRKVKRDLWLKVLRRHSLPVRPCSSYTFFVISTWDAVKSSSFGETSKRLGDIWFKLPHNEKKEFEDMAMKDTARYKRQCMLLRATPRL